MAEVIREIGEQLLKAVVKVQRSSQQPAQQSQPAPGDGDKEGGEGEEAAQEEKQNEDAEGDKGDEELASPSQETQTIPTVPSFILTRFIALAGHVALKMLVHLEFSVLNEIKRREAVQEESKQARKRVPKTPKTSRVSKVGDQ